MLELLDKFRNVPLLGGKSLHNWFIYPFLNHHPFGCIDRVLCIACSGNHCCTPATTLQVSEEAKGFLGLHGTHVLSCSGCDTAGCSANTPALSSMGHLLWPC